MACSDTISLPEYRSASSTTIYYVQTRRLRRRVLFGTRNDGHEAKRHIIPKPCGRVNPPLSSILACWKDEMWVDYLIPGSQGYTVLGLWTGASLRVLIFSHFFR